MAFNLSAKILIIGVATSAVCITLASVFVYASIQTTLEKQTSDNQLELTRQTFDKIDRLLGERQIDIQALTQQSQVRTLLTQRTPAATSAVNTNLSAFKSFAPVWESLSILGAGNVTLASTEPTAIGYEALASSDPSLVSLAKNIPAGTVVTSDLFIDKTTHQPGLVYLAPIFNGTTVIGLIEGRLSWSQVEAILNGVKTSSAFLLNQDGKVLGGNAHLGLGAGAILTKDYSQSTAFAEARKTTGGSRVTTAPDDPSEQSVVSYAAEAGVTGYSGHHWYLFLDTPTTVAFGPARHLTTTLLAFLGGAVFVGTLLSIYFQRKQIIRPLNRLSGAMSRVSLGDLTQTVATGSQDEIGLLGRNFNEMIRQLSATHRSLENASHESRKDRAQLAASINGLRQGFILTDATGKLIMVNSAAQAMVKNNAAGTQKTPAPEKLTIEHITHILPAELKLAEKISATIKQRTPAKFPNLPVEGHYLSLYLSPVITEDETIGCVLLLEDVTEERIMQRSRDEFFSIASHELRTPLTAIRGNTALIQQYYEKALEDKDLHDMVGDIHESSVRLIEIVNDFLDASRLEQDKMKFVLQDISIEPIVETVVYEMAGISRDKAVAIKFDHNLGSLPEVYADANRVKQVIYNLIGNAMKFTEQGSVNITAEVIGSVLKVYVIDTGLGISPEGQQLLFHKFQQANSSLLTRDTTRGTGLGLYISKLLVEHMGGQVKLEHSEVGKGTTFSFTIPLAGKSKKT